MTGSRTGPVIDLAFRRERATALSETFSRPRCRSLRSPVGRFETSALAALDQILAASGHAPGHPRPKGPFGASVSADPPDHDARDRHLKATILRRSTSRALAGATGFPLARAAIAAPANTPGAARPAVPDSPAIWHLKVPGRLTVPALP